MKLELPEKKHEKQYLEMIQEILDNTEMIVPRSLAMEEWESYDAFIQRMKENREKWSPYCGGIKSTLYFLIDDHKKVIGAEVLRHELNDDLRFNWWNIGYGIRPSERRKWYATIWLKLILEKCKEIWLDKALVNCRKDNIGSSKAIIKNWWIRDSDYEFEGYTKERYRIPVK